MKIFKTNKMLAVTAGNDAGDSLRLEFIILDTDVSDRWLAMINKNKSMGHTLESNIRRIMNIEERDKAIDAFRDNIAKINSMYDKQLADVVSFEYLADNQCLLNDLHEEFEVFGDREQSIIDMGYFDDPDKHPNLANAVWPGREYNVELHDRFLKLNVQIHDFEAIFKNIKDNQVACSCLADYTPAGIHERLKPEDFFLFEPNMGWGWMYLGYNTLGKNWKSILHDNDIDVVRRGQIRPQARFAAEFYIHFGDSTSIVHNRVAFYKWWMDNDLSYLHDPDMKLSEFAFGMIPVARVATYKINDNIPVSIMTAQTLKTITQWNTEVWSRFSTLIDVSVFNIEEMNL